jgi:hypothetical protein
VLLDCSDLLSNWRSSIFLVYCSSCLLSVIQFPTFQSSDEVVEEKVQLPVLMMLSVNSEKKDVTSRVAWLFLLMVNTCIWYLDFVNHRTIEYHYEYNLC